MTNTPAKSFSSSSVVSPSRFITEAVQTALLLKYFIITNNSAVAIATINLYMEDVNGVMTRIAPNITLQPSSVGYNISLIESEGHVVLYPNQKINLQVVTGDVSAVFSLVPPP